MSRYNAWAAPVHKGVCNTWRKLFFSISINFGGSSSAALQNILYNEIYVIDMMHAYKKMYIVRMHGYFSMAFNRDKESVFLFFAP